MFKFIRRSAAVLLLASAACAPNDPAETAASPVVGGTRQVEQLDGPFSVSSTRTGDDHVRTAKLFAPAPAVWDALSNALTDRKVPLTLVDRGAGRVGDTSMVIMRRLAGNSLSTYLQCGSNMTGARADQDRIRAVLLGQLSRLRADTVGVTVHFSAFATSLTTGGEGATAQCTSTGRLEAEILDDLIRRVGGSGVRKG